MTGDEPSGESGLSEDWEPVTDPATPRAQEALGRVRGVKAPEAEAAVERLRAGELVPAHALVAAPRQVRFPTASMDGIVPGETAVGDTRANRQVATIKDIRGEDVPLTEHGLGVVRGMQRQGFTAIAFSNRQTRREAAKQAERDRVNRDARVLEHAKNLRDRDG